MSGTRRLVLSGLALTALLAFVAVASHAHRPGGGSGGGTTHAPKLLFEYAASLMVVLFPLGVVVVVWVMSLRRRERLLKGGSISGQFRLLLLIACIAIPAAFATRHFIHYGSPQQKSSPRVVPGKDPAPPRVGTADAQFQWVPALVLGSLIVAGAGGVAALLVWKRRSGADWESEAALAAALDDVIADTLDDLRAERDPRRAVIGAYARMEATFAAYRVQREPAETSREYVDRVLDSLGVSVSSVKRLTALYERAKFSSHAIDVTMKDDAIDALAGLRAELEADGKVAA